jgi:hypothetical protein
VPDAARPSDATAALRAAQALRRSRLSGAPVSVIGLTLGV